MDERRLDELFDSKTKGAKRGRNLAYGLIALACIALLTGGAYGVRAGINAMRQDAPAQEPPTGETVVEAPSEETPAAETPTDNTPAQEPVTETAQEAAPEAPQAQENDTDSQSADNKQEQEKTEVPPAQEGVVVTVTHELRVEWPEEGIEKFPNAVYIKVMYGGEQVQFIELNEKKQWKESWQDSYTVDQLELKGSFPQELNASVKVDGQNFVIVMEPNPDAGSTQTSNRIGDDELVQTGIQWLSPAEMLLAGTGLCFLGVRLKERERNA